MVTSRRIAELIEQTMEQEDVDLADYDRLLKMQEREARMMASLATRLRITKQARVAQDGTGDASTTRPKIQFKKRPKND
ncbi:MAG: hypothetical protein AAGJ52_13285 [Pseudomonadota bacterium]